MKVLHVCQPVEGGAARITFALATDQVGRGWKVVVVAPQAGQLRSWLEESGIASLSWEARRSPGISTLGESLRLARMIASVQPDLIHLHSSKAGLAGRLALRGRRPTVFQPHGWSFYAVTGMYAAAARRWEGFAGRWTHAVVAVSEDEIRRGKEAGVRARFELAPLGVDLSRFPAATAGEHADARSRFDVEGPAVVCLGRLDHAKGQDVLLSAWPDVIRRIPEAHLYLVGDGPERTRLESHPSAGVTFVGHDDHVRTWLCAADLVVVPSRWEGGASLATIEAMATGRSVVATRVPGMSSVLVPQALTPIEDPRALAAAIVDRLEKTATRVEEGERNRAWAEQHGDIQHSADAVAGLYQQLVGGRPF